MNELKNRVLEFINRFQMDYIVSQSAEAVLSALQEEIVWTGILEAGHVKGRTEVHRLILWEFSEFKNPFRIMNSSYEIVNIQKDIFYVTGSADVKEISPDLNQFCRKLRISAVCVLSRGEVKLSQIHFSMPYQYIVDKDVNSVLENENTDTLREFLNNQAEQLKDRNRELQALTDNIPGGVFRCAVDGDLTLLHVSDGFLGLLGYSREELSKLFGGSFRRLIYEEDRELAFAEAERQLKAGNTKELEYRIVCKNGNLIWVLDKGQLVKMEGEKDSFYCILMDITREKMAKEELNLSLERHKIILNQTTDIVFEWDIQKDSLIMSTNWKKKFGYDPIKKSASRMVLKTNQIHPEDSSKFQVIIDEIRSGQPYSETEFRIKNREKRFIWCHIRVTSQFNSDGNPVKAIGVIVDIDAQKKIVQNLMEKAEKDALTGLYNKMTAQTLIEEYLASGVTVVLNALMIIDIDNFKMVNDTKGHLFGDTVLAEIASGLKKLFRRSDIVGRIGGDEFIVFLKNTISEEMTMKKAHQIVKMFQNIFVGKKEDYHISCSIGIVMHPKSGDRFNLLYKCADIALYKAKSAGKNCCIMFEESLRTEHPFSYHPVSYVNETIDSNMSRRGLGDQLVDYVFRALYKSNDIAVAVSLMLEIVGKQFDVSRVYIFEDHEDGIHCSNTFEWCNEGINSEIDRLKNLSYNVEMKDYKNNYNENGLFYCSDIKSLPSVQFSVLVSQGIKSLIQSAIYDNGQMKGFVGFDECRSQRFWTQEQIDVLTLISEILSTFLMKQRAQERAVSANENLKAILDKQNSWIYAVDKKDYSLMYINNKTLAFVPGVKLGTPCYEAFFQRESPCDVCPAALIEGEQTCSMEIYNEILKVWTMTDATPIKWNGTDACLLTCHDITRFKL